MITKGDAGESLTDTLRDIATPVVNSEIWNPPWLTPKMLLTTAAKEAHMRGCYLTVRWDPTMGMTVVATRRPK